MKSEDKEGEVTSESRKLVLVVDDNPGIIKFVSIQLRTAGYDVITASDGEEALRLVKSKKPDIMLLDLFMPLMNGFEVLRRLRAFSMLPVVVYSSDPEAAESSLFQGANAFITKPFDFEELEKIFRIVLEG